MPAYHESAFYFPKANIKEGIPLRPFKQSQPIRQIGHPPLEGQQRNGEDEIVRLSF